VAEGSARDAQQQAQRALLEELARILQGELDAMLAGQPLQLPELAARKSALCAELERLGTDALGDELRGLLKEVARANARNGAIVAAMIRNTQGAIDILRGAVGGGDVYDPRGQSRSPSSRPLGSA
jgi:flagellar biosynthesis/type III secretory pathway chaperone